MTQYEATSHIDALCLDVNDPRHMAQFWGVALGWEVDESDGECALVPTDGTRFGILRTCRRPLGNLRIVPNDLLVVETGPWTR